MASSSIEYRPEIDGLRAIAVLSVLIYHLNIDALPGGFIGVSVFFVISGYLITQILRRELEGGTFSFKIFFERRARRILPALITVLLTTSALALMILTPIDLVNFSHSLLTSLIFISNIHFLENTDYFFRYLYAKPLLHTWSLAVEMQFYLLWPIILVVAHRAFRTRITLLIAAIILASYAAAEWLMLTDGTAVFFLLPFRSFELAIGALLAYLPARKQHPSNDLLFLCGLLIIIGVAVTAEKPILDAWRYHLLPCIGAALIIYAGTTARTRTMLSNPAMVGIGLISYSLYLVHWPVIAYYKYLGFPPVGWVQALILSGISIALSVLIYRFIETPFRRARIISLRSVVIILSPCMVMLATLAYMIDAQEGMKWRIDPARMAKASTFEDFGMGDFAYLKVNKVGDAQVDPSFIMVGDSQAAQYFYGLHTLLQQYQKSALVYAVPGCFFAPDYTVHDQGKIREGCSDAYAKLHEMTQGNDLPIVFSYNWVGYRDSILGKDMRPHGLYTEDNLKRFMHDQLAVYRRDFATRRIIILGAAPDLVPNDILARCHYMPSIFLPGGCQGKTHIARSEFKMYDDFNSTFDAFAKSHANTDFINPMEIYCDTTTCQLMSENARWFFDTWHLSREGSVRAINYFSGIFLSLAPSTTN